MRETNGEKVSLNDAAGVAALLLGLGQHANDADATEKDGVQEIASYIQHTRDAVAAARPEVIVGDSTLR